MPETLRRILWFVGLWLAGLATISVVAFAIRMAIG